MKVWKSPEMKVFSVKMDENIAASGEPNDDVQKGFIFHANQANGGYVYWGDGGNYWYTDDGNIQDSGVYIINYEGDHLVLKSDAVRIAGCLA